MKRIIALFIAIMMLTVLCFTSCGKSTNTTGAGKLNIPEKGTMADKAAALYLASEKYLESVSSLRTTEDIDIAYGYGNTVTTYTISNIDLSQYDENGRMTAMDNSQAINMGTSVTDYRYVYFDGMYYSKAGNQRFVSKVTQDEFEKITGTKSPGFRDAFDITKCNDVTFTKNPDGTYLVEFASPNEELIANVTSSMQAILTAVSSNVKLNDFSGSATFDKNGVKTNEETVFSFTGSTGATEETEGTDVSLDVTMKYAVESINKDVEIGAPMDAAFYCEVEDAQILSVIDKAMTSYVNAAENDIILEEKITLTGAINYARTMQTTIAYEFDDDDNLTFVQNVKQNQSGEQAVSTDNYEASWVYDGKNMSYFENGEKTVEETSLADATDYIEGFIVKPYVSSSEIMNVLEEDLTDGGRKLTIELNSDSAQEALSEIIYSLGIDVTNVDNSEYTPGQMFIVLDANNEILACKYDMQLSMSKDGKVILAQYTLQMGVNPKGTTTQQVTGTEKPKTTDADAKANGAKAEDTASKAE